MINKKFDALKNAIVESTIYLAVTHTKLFSERTMELSLQDQEFNDSLTGIQVDTIHDLSKSESEIVEIFLGYSCMNIVESCEDEDEIAIINFFFLVVFKHQNRIVLNTFMDYFHRHIGMENGGYKSENYKDNMGFSIN